MAKGGGAQQNKGGGARGGGGKKTARSQQYNYLRQFGYPSMRELRREAQGLAFAATPTIREVSTPFNQQMRSTRDYLAAVQSALAQTSQGVNQGYDASLQQAQGVDAAAQQRLAGLGLGADSAGVQAATGARGDSQTQALIADAAAAKHAAAQMPTIAAGAASQNQQVLQGKLLDALSNRRDQLSQAFFQALNTAQSQGLAKAQFNQSQYQFGQQMQLQQAQMAQQASQFAAQEADARASRHQQAFQFREQMIAQSGYDPVTGQYVQGSAAASQSVPGIAKKYGMTAGQVITLQQHSNQQVASLLAKGTNWKTAIQIAEANDVPPEIARQAVIYAYSNPSTAGVVKPPLPAAYKPSTQFNPQTMTRYKGRIYAATQLSQWQADYSTYRQQAALMSRALKGFDVGYLWRQLQKQYDSVMHAPAYSTEH
jgi:hypothetical protein